MLYHLRNVSLFAIAVFCLIVALPASASGLLVPDNRELPPLRITDHLVNVEINDKIAITKLTQTFRNDHNQRVEATYVFPLPEEADLTDFKLSFNGKMVEGEVLPADEARQIYESIVRQAKDPGLIEFIGRRLLRMRIFPIEPKSDTTIEIRYQQLLQPTSGMNGYTYPLRTNQTDGKAFGTVRFDVTINSSGPLKNVWSPTHAVETVRDGEYKAKVGYEASGGSLEEDFRLLYSTDDSDLGLSTIAFKPDAEKPGHFLLMLTPKQLWPDDEYLPQDVVFVLDTSGSMAGDNGVKLTQAREALKYCINQLDERDRFSVVRFSTGFDVLYDKVSDATEENRAVAIEFIDRFKAAGGTNIADTLQHVMQMNPQDSGRPFVVVFLTDGEGNRTADEIIQVLKEQGEAAASARIFSFGVGHDVNTKLLDRLANQHHGRPIYVQPGEDLELVLGDFFATISQPVLTDLKLIVPNIGVTDRFPVTLGDLYHGQQLTIAGQFATEQTGDIKLTAMRRGEQVEFTWNDIVFTSTESADYVASIWAGRKIAFLIDEIREHGESQEMVDEIVQLSQQYGIQTPYTSWLVNPEQVEILTRRGIDIGGVQPMQDGLVRERLGRLAESESAPMQQPRFSGSGNRGRAPASPVGGGMGGGGRGGGVGESDAADDLSLEEAAEAVTATSGRDATIIAEYQSRMREDDNRDKTRLDREGLVVRKIAGRWYHRVGPFLVDESIDDEMELVQIAFTSDAYFELMAARPELKKLFAASKFVAFPLTDKHAAVIVADSSPENGKNPDETGEIIDQFSQKLRELYGLSVRR